MNTRTLPLGRMSWMMVALAAIGVIALSAAVLVRPVYAAGDKATICHANSGPKEFVVITIDEGASGFPHLDSNGSPLNGHEQDFLLAGEATVLDCQEAADLNHPTVATIIVPAGPVAIGTIAHDTAQISLATEDAGGTISYTLFDNDACTGDGIDLTPDDNAVVDGAAPDSNTFTFNSAGTFYFYAVYSGDSNNTGNNSGCAAEPYTVNPNAPTVATVISPAGPVAIGTIAHDTAQISGATATAGGTISYALYSNNDCSGLLANLTPTVNAVVAGAAPDSKTFTFTGAGTFYFYAVYSGDSNNTGPVNSGCAAEPYTVNPGEIVVLTGTGTPAPSTEIVVLAGSGTPAPSVANTALSQNGVSPIPTIAFSLILLASLATLAYANVKTVRSRS